MKQNMNASQPNPTTGNNKKRAENKDNLDSRKNEEFEVKGDDITHNQKETKAGKQKKH